MTIDNFIEKTKVTINNDLINYVIDGFLKSNVSFYKPESSLMLYLETDKDNKGKVSKSQIDNFINHLMLDKLKNKYGKDQYLFVPENVRINDAQKEIGSISDVLKKNTFVNINATGIVGRGALSFDHIFVVNVRPEEYIEVLNTLYERVRDLGRDDVLICACSPNYAGIGYNAPIKINCSVEALEDVLNMLDKMEYSFTSKTQKVLPIYDRMNTWYGYDQYDSYNKVEASAIFTMAIFNAIQKTFYTYLDQDVKIDDILIRDYYDSKPNKLQAMRDIINNSIKLEDALLANIILNTRNELSEFGLTTTNILNVPIIEARMQECYGYQFVGNYESQEPEGIAEEIINEMVFYEPEKKSVPEVIPVTTNIVMENDDNVIDDIETFEFSEITDSKNGEIKEYDDAREQVNKVDEENKVVDHNPDKLELINPDSNCLEYQLLDGTVIPDLADIAYRGESLEEALRSGGYRIDFDYICDVAKHFHMDYTGSVEDQEKMLYILRNLSKYYFDGTPKEEEKKSTEKNIEITNDDEKVLRNKEEAFDEQIISSIENEINRAVQEVVNSMREAAKSLPDVANISEVDEKQYENFSDEYRKEEKIEEKKEQYGNLGKELDSKDSITKIMDGIDDNNYFVNAGYLIKFADNFQENRSDKDQLTQEELTSLRESGIETLNNSLERLADLIKDDAVPAVENTKSEEISDDRLEKYAYLVDDLDNLRKKVKNSDQTVLEYFEKEEIEKNIKGDEILNFHDYSKKTAKEFVNGYLINYLVNFGYHELSYILALYADSIEDSNVLIK